jgi:hypothetical protein
MLRDQPHRVLPLVPRIYRETECKLNGAGRLLQSTVAARVSNWKTCRLGSMRCAEPIPSLVAKRFRRLTAMIQKPILDPQNRPSRGNSSSDLRPDLSACPRYRGKDRSAKQVSLIMRYQISRPSSRSRGVCRIAGNVWADWRQTQRAEPRRLATEI